MTHETIASARPPQVAVDAVARGTDARRSQRLGAAAGIVFVALQVALVAVVAGAPGLDASESEIRSYLVDDGRNLLLATTIGVLSMSFFIWFLGSLQAFLRAAEGSLGYLHRVAFGAGLVTITLVTSASMPAVALAWEDTAANAEPGLLKAVWNLNTLAFVPAGSSAAIFCLAAALVILLTRMLPAWLGWIGVLAAVAGELAVFYIVTDDPDSPLGTPANLGGFLLSMLFILLLSVFMVIRLGRSEPATA